MNTLYQKFVMSWPCRKLAQSLYAEILAVPSAHAAGSILNPRVGATECHLSIALCSSLVNRVQHKVHCSGILLTHMEMSIHTHTHNCFSASRCTHVWQVTSQALVTIERAMAAMAKKP